MGMLHELMQQAECTPRLMSKLRGKCGHQFRCRRGASFLGPFQSVCRSLGGPESQLKWDTPKQIPDNLRGTMRTLFKWLSGQYEKGAEMSCSTG
jgi:hypothetical protein